MLHPKARMLGLLILLIAGMWVAIGQAGGVNTAATPQSNNGDGVQGPTTPPQPPPTGQVISYARVSLRSIHISQSRQARQRPLSLLMMSDSMS